MRWGWANGLIVVTALCGTGRADLYENFRNPPVEVRPWAYWLVRNTLTDKETIDADFSDMAALGFGGVLTTDSRAYHVDDNHLLAPTAQVRWGSAEWQDLMAYAIRAAAKNKITFAINIAASGGHLRGDVDAGADNPKQLIFKRYLPGDRFEKPSSPYFEDVCIFAAKLRQKPQRSKWLPAADGAATAAPGAQHNRRKDGGVELFEATEVRALATAEEGSGLGEDWVVVRMAADIVPNAPEDIDVLDPAAVTRHLCRSFDGLFEKVPDLVGSNKTFVALYNVSWEGMMPTWSPRFASDYERILGRSIFPDMPALAGFSLPDRDAAAIRRDFRRARGQMMAENFYETVCTWAHRRGILAFSESGGPWVRTPDVFGECDQMQFLAANDFPQGEFWPEKENGTTRGSGHANMNGRYFHRGVISAAHVFRSRIASAEAFTHMHRHWSVDPAFLKPVGDQAFADGINRFVWHTYTSSPARYGVPGLEFFAGSHINRNVTWHDYAAPFVKYLGRCQSILQAGDPVTDILVVGDNQSYCHWSHSDDTDRQQKNGRHRHLVSDEDSLLVNIPVGYAYDFTSEAVCSALPDLEQRYPVSVRAKDALSNKELLPRLLKGKQLLPDVAMSESGWTWCHRRMAEGDFYYIVGEGSNRLTFRARASVIELWDPVTGERHVVDGEALDDGRTSLRVELPVGGSAIVAFLSRKPENPARRRRSLTGVTSVSGEWKVSFSYPKGVLAEPPSSIQLDALVDFTMRDDLKHFSGKATYETSFSYDDTPEDALLSLGNVPSGLAHIILNEKDCGVCWCAPWRVDVSRAIQKGVNRLKITYVNNWCNRLVGDCQADEAARVTRSNLHYWDQKRASETGRPWRFTPTLYSGYCPNDGLQSSGLLGPIEVLSRGERAGKIIRDVSYDSSIGRYGCGDLYLPKKVTASTPVVLMIHGGGWGGGNRNSLMGIVELFRRDIGCAVFAIDYRLASEDCRWPACGDDCIKAARFVLSEDFGKRFGLPNQKIWLVGGSAGGHLALWTLGHLESKQVAGVVSISAVGDPRIDHQVNPKRYRKLFGRDPDIKDFASMDPLALIKPGMPSLLCTHADGDMVVPVASHKAYAEAYRKAGNDVSFFEYSSECLPGLTGHCMWRPMVKPNKLVPCLEERIVQFVQRVGEMKCTRMRREGE